MIPTMIVFGLITGRWWRLALVAAAILWPALLLVDGAMGVSASLLVAALLGAVNAAIGVAVHQALLWLVRRLRPGAAGQPT